MYRRAFQKKMCVMLLLGVVYRLKGSSSRSWDKILQNHPIFGRSLYNTSLILCFVGADFSVKREKVLFAFDLVEGAFLM